MTTPTAGPPAPFPSTMWSEILSFREGDDAARRERLEQLARRYWKPVYWALRAEPSVTPEEAADLAQEFFLRLMEGRILAAADPDRGSFRKYLKACLRNFLLHELRDARALKRGGGAAFLPLEAGSLLAAPAPAGGPEQALDRAWAAELLEEAVRDLDAALRPARALEADVFRDYELADPAARPSYADLAARHGVTPREIRTALRAGRRELRALLAGKIRHYVHTESDAAGEFRELFES